LLLNGRFIGTVSAEVIKESIERDDDQAWLGATANSGSKIASRSNKRLRRTG
jgi:hypothetical protein